MVTSYGAKVSIRYIQLRGIVACGIFLLGGLAMCDSLRQRGGRESNLFKKSMTYV